MKTFTLGVGPHTSLDGLAPPGSIGCVNEIASMLAGERWGDKPECVCPLVGGLAIRYNDSYTRDEHLNKDEFARDLPWRLVGTRSGPFLRHRSDLTNDWLFRTVLPAALRSAGHPAMAEQLVNLPATAGNDAKISLLVQLAGALNFVAIGTAQVDKLSGVLEYVAARAINRLIEALRTRGSCSPDTLVALMDFTAIIGPLTVRSMLRDILNQLIAITEPKEPSLALKARQQVINENENGLSTITGLYDPAHLLLIQRAPERS